MRTSRLKVHANRAWTILCLLHVRPLGGSPEEGKQTNGCTPFLFLPSYKMTLPQFIARRGANLLSLILCLCSFTACGGEDDEDAVDSSVTDTEASKFIGTWLTSNSKGYETAYQFWSDGCAYIVQASNLSSSDLKNLGSGHSEDEDHSDNYKWTYDSSTSTLATTITDKSPVGNYSSSLGSTFTVTAIGDGFWSGYIQNGEDVYSFTFTQVTSNLYNP